MPHLDNPDASNYERLKLLVTLEKTSTPVESALLPTS
jgi:hypothetical protein